jgi:glutamate dehydrogenase
MVDVADEELASLLDKAAGLAEAGGTVISGAGDLRNYLGAYYRQMPLEELVAAGPARMAGVAAEHARMAANRPQGRALVQVSASGLCSALEDTRGAVDIVTDDMPFLVDSITMELTRHGLDSFHIIHPQLLVRRDVTGTLWEVVGPLREGKRGHDEIAESWTHIEIDTSSGVSLAELEEDLQRVLLDVRAAVEDYPKMAGAAVRLADKLETEGPKPPAETQALLRWLAANHFTFLGYREYDLVDGPQGMALVPVPGTGLGILRHDKRGSASFAALPPQVRARAKDPQRLILTKANSRSTVHRRSYLDYIAIKRVNDVGEVVGEYRFLGLYTHEAYHESIARIPVLRRKLAEVLERTGVAPDSHDGKDLTEILEGYPREELFSISVEELLPIALGVLHLRSHPRTRLFLRKDVYGRFMSCVVYLPRDRYTTRVRLRTQDILRAVLHGETVEYSATVGESPLARLLVVVRAKAGTTLPDVDTADLEAKIVAAARSWEEDLAGEAARAPGGAPGPAPWASPGRAPC